MCYHVLWTLSIIKRVRKGVAELFCNDKLKSGTYSRRGLPTNCFLTFTAQGPGILHTILHKGEIHSEHCHHYESFTCETFDSVQFYHAEKNRLPSFLLGTPFRGELIWQNKRPSFISFLQRKIVCLVQTALSSLYSASESKLQKTALMLTRGTQSGPIAFLLAD